VKTNVSDPQEQLEIISQTIAKAKENLSEHSFAFIFWGWLVSLTALFNYVLLVYSSLGNLSYLAWPITTLMGFAAMVMYYRKKEKKKKHQTHVEYFLSKLWIVIGCVLLFFSLTFPFVKFNPWFFYPIIVGIGTAVTGAVLKFKPLVFGGFVLLSFPLYSVLVSKQALLVLYAGVIIVSYLIPGYLLKNHQS
jgi:hypothetical protein